MKRKSNIELLRIISMALVILSHYSRFGRFNFENLLSFNAILIKFLHAGGKIGVTIFIFISGYFLSQSKKFNLSKQIKLILEVLFYDLFIIIISLFIGTFNIKDGIKQLFSILFDLHPFVNGYLIMVFLSPFINKLLNNLKLAEHIKLSLLLLTVMYIFPTLIPAIKINIEAIYYITIYIFASLYKKCENNISITSRQSISIGIISIIIILISEFVLTYLGIKLHANVLLNNSEHFRNLYSVLTLITSISLFIGFQKEQIKNNIRINNLASVCFAVFLVHNGRLIRSFIWDEIFKTYTYQNSKILILNAITSVILIYLTVYLIDTLRQKLERKIMDKIDKKIEIIEEKFNSNIEKLESNLSK